MALNNTPLKVGQGLHHDVRGYGSYTSKCQELQPFNTSSKLIYIDFGTGAGPELVRKSCLTFIAADPGAAVAHHLEVLREYNEMVAQGIVEVPTGMKQIVVQVCPNCSEQQTALVEDTYSEINSPELEFCHNCARQFGHF